MAHEQNAKVRKAATSAVQREGYQAGRLYGPAAIAPSIGLQLYFRAMFCDGDGRYLSVFAVPEASGVSRCRCRSWPMHRRITGAGMTAARPPEPAPWAGILGDMRVLDPPWPPGQFRPE